MLPNSNFTSRNARVYVKCPLAADEFNWALFRIYRDGDLSRRGLFLLRTGKSPRHFCHPHGLSRRLVLIGHAALSRVNHYCRPKVIASASRSWGTMNHQIASGESQSPRPRVRPTRVACKACNARRVKCDAAEGQPCWRCRLQNLPCELIDSKRGKYVIILISAYTTHPLHLFKLPSLNIARVRCIN